MATDLSCGFRVALHFRSTERPDSERNGEFEKLSRLGPSRYAFVPFDWTVSLGGEVTVGDAVGRDL